MQMFVQILLQMISNVHCCQKHNEIANARGVATCSTVIACGNSIRIIFNVTANRFGKSIHAMQITNMISLVMTTISPYIQNSIWRICLTTN